MKQGIHSHESIRLGELQMKYRTNKYELEFCCHFYIVLLDQVKSVQPILIHSHSHSVFLFIFVIYLLYSKFSLLYLYFNKNFLQYIFSQKIILQPLNAINVFFFKLMLIEQLTIEDMSFQQIISHNAFVFYLSLPTLFFRGKSYRSYDILLKVINHLQALQQS